jgi:hypothetical protein
MVLSFFFRNSGYRTPICRHDKREIDLFRHFWGKQKAETHYKLRFVYLTQSKVQLKRILEPFLFSGGCVLPFPRDRVGCSLLCCLEAACLDERHATDSSDMLHAGHLDQGRRKRMRAALATEGEFHAGIGEQDHCFRTISMKDSRKKVHVCTSEG